MNIVSHYKMFMGIALFGTSFQQRYNFLDNMYLVVVQTCVYSFNRQIHIFWKEEKPAQ